MEKQEIIPVFLGAGISTYNLARFFYKEYNVKSYIFCKNYTEITNNSKFVNHIICKDMTKNARFLYYLIKFGKEHVGKKLFLMSNSDEMSNKIIYNYQYLKKYYISPCISKELARSLENKESFYKICEQHGLDYPKFITIAKENYSNFTIPFDFPVIIKPTESIEYSFLKFEGKRKVYKCYNHKEAKEFVELIYNSGYSSNLICQEYLDGDDDNCFVLNTYSSKTGKVKCMALGNIYLQTRHPRHIGNYIAIKSVYNKELCVKIKKFLEDIKYIGFANIDMKYDAKEKKFKLFEINLRLGKASSYCFPAGCNMIKVFVEDYIENNKNEQCLYADKEILWTLINPNKLKKYISNSECIKEIDELKKQKKIFYPLICKEDMSIKRLISAYSMMKEEEHCLKKYYKS